MQNITVIVATLAVAFAAQVAWWRRRPPARQIFNILWFFPAVFLVASLAAVHQGLLDVDAAGYARLALLYLSLVLCYAIVFSAVEVSSPTLSIVSYLAGKGMRGCAPDDLTERFMREGDMLGRLKLMEVGGLVAMRDESCRLTPKGLFYAKLFAFAARFFGLPRGG
jgi:hypothetical protein